MESTHDVYCLDVSRTQKLPNPPNCPRATRRKILNARRMKLEVFLGRALVIGLLACSCFPCLRSSHDVEKHTFLILGEFVFSVLVT